MIEDIFKPIDKSINSEDNFTLLDKSSAEYKKAHATNEASRIDASLESDDPLTNAIKEAAHLKEDVKEKYINLAACFLEDMQLNIFRNQFQLAKNYPDYSVDEWNDFLNDRIVKVYITKHKRTLLKASAEDNLANPLAKNKRDNLKLIENLQAQEDSENAHNIVIMRVPNIYDEDDAL